MIKIKRHTNLIAIRKALPLFEKLYPKKSRKEILDGLRILKKNHRYSLLIAYKDKEAVGIVGLSIGFLLYSGKYLQISSLYIDPKHRNEGIAQALFATADQVAKAQNCEKIVLDSYVTNQESHKTYLREDFEIKAYHFMKEL